MFLIGNKDKQIYITYLLACGIHQQRTRYLSSTGLKVTWQGLNSFVFLPPAFFTTEIVYPNSFLPYPQKRAKFLSIRLL